MSVSAQTLGKRKIGLPSCNRVTYPDEMNVDLDDSALMMRYKDGDITAFESLYYRHNDSLYRYLLRLSRNSATAEDVFQESWSKVIMSRERYRPTAKFSTFLFRIGHNCFIDHTRRNKRHLSGGLADPELIVDSADGPEKSTDRYLARQMFESALLSLPEDQRDAFLLHEEGGLDLDSIAYITGVNRETAKSRIRYAIKKLKSALSLAIEKPSDTA